MLGNPKQTAPTAQAAQVAQAAKEANDAQASHEQNARQRAEQDAASAGVAAGEHPAGAGELRPISGSECCCCRWRYEVRWYVMRDLKRPNSKSPAYRMLGERGFEVFTPMKWQLVERRGKQIRVEAPVVSGLLFVRSAMEKLHKEVEVTPTLQFRYVRGAYQEPMFVPDNQMDKFIHAVQTAHRPKFFLPEEITPQMLGHTVRITGGPFKGYEGKLLSQRGSKYKRLLVELPQMLTVGVEVERQYIQLVKIAPGNPNSEQP